MVTNNGMKFCTQRLPPKWNEILYTKAHPPHTPSGINTKKVGGILKLTILQNGCMERQL